MGWANILLLCQQTNKINIDTSGNNNVKRQMISKYFQIVGNFNVLKIGFI
jgi:hypothetical protein